MVVEVDELAGGVIGIGRVDVVSQRLAFNAACDVVLV